MLGTNFQHDMIRKLVVAFGTLFNNIKIKRTDADGDQWLSIPLTYSAKEKWYNRLTDPNLAQQVQSTLPRMGYEMVDLAYAPDRHLNTMNQRVTQLSVTDSYSSLYSPVPYDVNFQLAVYSRNQADAAAIVEQILPFFTPEFTITIADGTANGPAIDVPIILNDITKEDAYEGDFETARTIIWTLNFTMKANMFGPAGTAKLIKKAYVDFFIPDSTVRYINGTLALDSTAANEIYLQANNSSRTSNLYTGAAITITGEGSGTANVAGNTRTILTYDGDTRRAVVTEAFLDTPLSTWTYSIAFRSDDPLEYGSPEGQGLPTVSRIYIEPGLTAAGDPTTNSQLTVGVDSIDSDDDWGVIQTQTFFPSNTTLVGTRRNLYTGVDE